MAKNRKSYKTSFWDKKKFSTQKDHSNDAFPKFKKYEDEVNGPPKSKYIHPLRFVPWKTLEEWFMADAPYRKDLKKRKETKEQLKLDF